MLGKLEAFFGKSNRAEVSTRQRVETVVAPERSFFAVGDIHGCEDQLTQLMSLIEAEAKGDEAVIFLGDAIDRGPASARVLEWLYATSHQNEGDVVVLMGNHERMMLDFIDDPAGRGARWLSNGGIETLLSFDINCTSPNLDSESALKLSEQLCGSLPHGMLNWLRTLPLKWRTGNIYCVHAAMNPSKAPEAQSERVLIWGHPDFQRIPRDDGVCVVHGHTIVPTGIVRSGRIAVDTGAYRGGRLTAASVQTGECRFLQTAGHLR